MEKKSQSNQEKASAMTEMALVLPVLLMFLLGIIQYGYILAGKISLENAAGVLARQVLIQPTIADSQSEMTSIVGAAMNGMLQASGIKAIIVDDTLVVNGESAIGFEIQYDLPVFFSLVVPNAAGGKITISANSITKEM